MTGFLATAPALAVRVNPDGHGQALIYPYYTARATISGKSFVTALSVVNTMSKPKVVRVRLYEGRAGAEVHDFNLFLAANDVWTAGIVGAGAGAGIYTADHSCTSPQVGSNAANPSRFRNGAYGGIDQLGNSLDRTYEGYLEVLEMATIDPASALAANISPRTDLSEPNASRPPCLNLPSGDIAPQGLSLPTGGLVGNASFINVNEGTDFNVNAVALSRWSDKIQWSSPGSASPSLADANPPISTVIDTGVDEDRMIITRWETGRDAVSAVLMVDRIINDYTVERSINASTDWIVTMPTRRYYKDAAGANFPFLDRNTSPASYTEELTPAYDDGLPPPGLFYDREGQDGHQPHVCFICVPYGNRFVGVTGAWSWVSAFTTPSRPSAVVASALGTSQVLAVNFQSGYGQLQIVRDLSFVGSHTLRAPIGASTVIDVKTGAVRVSKNAIYHGLPVIGFAVHTFSTTGLPGMDPNVLARYGGAFSHNVSRHIEVTP